MKTIISVGYYHLAVTGLDIKAIEALTNAEVVDQSYSDNCYYIQKDKTPTITIVKDDIVKYKPVQETLV